MVARAPQNLYVDGPVNCRGMAAILRSNAESVVVSQRYCTESDINFVEASNPHSGMFCITAEHLKKIRDSRWPPTTFVSPLETAATGGVSLPYFPIFKTSWSGRKIFEIVYGNPLFLGYLGVLQENTTI